MTDFAWVEDEIPNFLNDKKKRITVRVECLNAPHDMSAFDPIKWGEFKATLEIEGESRIVHTFRGQRLCLINAEKRFIQGLCEIAIGMGYGQDWKESGPLAPAAVAALQTHALRLVAQHLSYDIL